MYCGTALCHVPRVLVLNIAAVFGDKALGVVPFDTFAEIAERGSVSARVGYPARRVNLSLCTFLRSQRGTCTCSTSLFVRLSVYCTIPSYRPPRGCSQHRTVFAEIVKSLWRVSFCFSQRNVSHCALAAVLCSDCKSLPFFT